MLISRQNVINYISYLLSTFLHINYRLKKVFHLLTLFENKNTKSNQIYLPLIYLKVKKLEQNLVFQKLKKYFLIFKNLKKEKVFIIRK